MPWTGELDGLETGVLAGAHVDEQDPLELKGVIRRSTEVEEGDGSFAWIFDGLETVRPGESRRKTVQDTARLGRVQKYLTNTTNSSAIATSSSNTSLQGHHSVRKDMPSIPSEAMEINSSEGSWPSLDSLPQPYEDHTMSLYDLGPDNDTSLCWQPNQESIDTWLNTSEAPDLILMDSDSWVSLYPVQTLLLEPSNGTFSDLGTGHLIMNSFSEIPVFAPSEVSCDNLESLSTRSPESTFQDPFSSQSPCSEFLFHEQTSVFHTPSILPAYPELHIGELIEPAGGSIQVIGLPEADLMLVPRDPERPPSDNTAGQLVRARRVKMREWRRIKLPEECPLCGKGHQFRTLMERHIRSNHAAYAQEIGIAKPPSICGICGRSFARSDHLYRHGQSKHGWPPRLKKKC